MSYVPSYTSRINWENEPSTASPINETNLNKMDYALYQHDQALQGQDSRISTLEGESKVTSFKGRTGAVIPADDDYTVAQIKATGTAGQVPTLNSQGKLEMADVPESGHEIVNPSGTSMTQRSKLKFMGSVSVSDDSANDQTVINVTGGGGGGSGHTIQNPSGSSMTQRTNLQFTGTGVTVTDNSAGDKTVVEINGGSGHTIKDGDGTAMTPQTNLQFADASVENDSTNNATVVRNFVDIDWDDWQEVDDNDDTYYRVKDAPLVDGNVEVDLMKKLWENPATTATFVGQAVTLSSDDYDFLMVVANVSTSDTHQIVVITTSSGGTLQHGQQTSENKWILDSRAFTFSGTSVTFDHSYRQQTTSSRSGDNSYNIPIAIYGIKQKVTISLSAIIANVSTSASKCMLSDGETSVEDALTKRTTTFDMTISANSNVTKTVSATGAFAIVGVYSSVTYAEICSFRANSDQIYVSMRNPSNASISPTITVDYLATS